MATLAELCSQPALSETKRQLIESVAAKIASICSCEVSLDFFKVKAPPPDVPGDIAIACFDVAKQLGKSPTDVAKFIAAHWVSDDVLLSADAVGPYCNISLNRQIIGPMSLQEVLNSDAAFGRTQVGAGKRVMIEYSSPNTNKPQHLGHVRNNLLGHVTANLLEAIGFDTIKASIINDRGIHICKSMLAYQMWGEGKTPASEGIKPDHFVGMSYVKFDQALQQERLNWYAARGLNPKELSDPVKRKAEAEFLAGSTLMQQAQAMLKAWEAGDEAVVAIWRQMNAWVYEGFNETYRELGVDFDRTYYESEIYKAGRDMIMDAVSQGRLMQRPDGSVLAELSKVTWLVRKKPLKLPDKVVLRSDGTSLYITQDMNLAGSKFAEYGIDYSIYCIASEQDLYMQQVFATLQLMGFAFAEKMYHLSYGMVYLPEGKMKSREGKVVDADDLIAGMREMAAVELETRFPEMSEEDRRARGRVIGDAALKYFILSFGREAPIYFDPKKSIAFEGNTGPYIQYTYARIASILRKLGNPLAIVPPRTSLSLDIEWPVLSMVMDFPSIVYQAAVNCEPSLLITYLFDMCRAFNTFYQKGSVVHASGEEQQIRIATLIAVQSVIQSGLKLLDIETLEEM